MYNDTADKYKIMIIEDCATTALLMTKQLSRFGYEVIGTVNSSDEAKELIDTCKPDLIFVDISLGEDEIGGIEIAEDIISRTDIPVIYQTAHIDDEILSKAMEMHPAGYLIKPVQPQMLKAMVELTVSHARADKMAKENYRWVECVAQNTEEALLVVDRLGRVRLANKVAEALLQKSKSEIEGCNVELVLQDLFIHGGKSIKEMAMEVREKEESIAWSGSCERGVPGSGGRVRIEGKLSPVFMGQSSEYKGYLAIFHDITDKKRIEDKLCLDIAKAVEIEKEALSRAFVNPNLSVKTVYYPYEQLSGDFYYYKWQEETGVLRGYVFDVSGHGVLAASFVPLVNVMFRETMKFALLPDEWMNLMNEKMMEHLYGRSFVAAVCFEFDFKLRLLRYSAAGINWTLHQTGRINGKVATKSMMLGVDDGISFGLMEVAFKRGDNFCFLTDGISDVITEDELVKIKECGIKALLSSIERERYHDDASALIVEIGSLCLKPKECFSFCGIKEYRKIQGRIEETVAGKVAEKRRNAFLIALNEAVTNALEHGFWNITDTLVLVTVKNIANKIISVRVKGEGAGFKGNQYLKNTCMAEKNNEAMSLEDTLVSMNERGRGIRVMQKVCDKVCYNAAGTEVLLAMRVDS